MPQKNNNMTSLSSTSANKSSMIHESPKDHSINIENAAPYYQGKQAIVRVLAKEIKCFEFSVCILME